MSTPEETINESNNALAARGTLLLTVRLETAEQADELMRWMYAREKPMKAELVEIAWDKVAIPKKLADALYELLAVERT